MINKDWAHLIFFFAQRPSSRKPAVGVIGFHWFFYCYQRRIQVTNATFRSWFINWLKTWFGVSKLSLFLGLLFSSFSTKLMYSSVMVSKFVFLGIYWRTKPLRFSFAPLSQLW